MGGCGSSSDDEQAMQADLERIAREKERIARERVPPIGLVVQREDGWSGGRLCTSEVEVEVRPWEPVHGSLGKALELDELRQKVKEAWLGQLQLEGEGSWESQGVVDGAAVRAVVEKKRGIVVVDAQNHRIQLLGLEDGSHVWSSRSGHAVPHPKLDNPQGAAVDRQGHVIVADSGNNRVQVLRLDDDSHVRTIGSEGWGPGEFKNPKDVAVDGQGHLAVADYGNNRVEVLRMDGSHVRTIGREGTGPGQFKGPSGVAMDEQGHLVVSDGNKSQIVDRHKNTHRVQVFRLEDGSHLRTIGGPKGEGPGQFYHPQGVEVDRQGHLVVADYGNNRVQVFRMEDGSHVRTIGSRGSGPGQFKGPSGVAMDDQGHLFVADLGNNRVQVFRLEDGSHLQSIGSKGKEPGQFSRPRSVAVVPV